MTSMHIPTYKTPQSGCVPERLRTCTVYMYGWGALVLHNPYAQVYLNPCGVHILVQATAQLTPLAGVQGTTV